jgi:hypothetical protein
VHSDQNYQSQNFFTFTFESSHSVMAARSRGVLPLQRDFDSTKFDKVKHSVTHPINNASSKTQVEIPKPSIGASRMEPISFITKFRRSATTMRWTNGPILFEKFPMRISRSQILTPGILLSSTQLKPWSVLGSALLLSKEASFLKMLMTSKSLSYVSSRNPLKWSPQHLPHCYSLP